MLYRIRHNLAVRRFNRAVRGIVDTPQEEGDTGSAVTLVSQLCHRDVLMYLSALKSFVRFVRPRRFVVLDDGSLTDEDKRTLARHAAPLEIVPIASVQNPHCPAGGTWERILYICDHIEDGYVIQMDADTLTVREPTEVIEAVAQNRSFTLGTDMGRETIGLTEASERAKGWFVGGDDHVQSYSEVAFEQLPNADTGKYVRGCSGFAGFRKGPSLRADAETFSREMVKLLPEGKWNEWGTEQITSNYLVANTDDPVILPFPKYGHYHPEADLDAAAFLHFIGTYRFTGGVYGRLVRQELLA